MLHLLWRYLRGITPTKKCSLYEHRIFFRIGIIFHFLQLDKLMVQHIVCLYADAIFYTWSYLLDFNGIIT